MGKKKAFISFALLIAAVLLSGCSQSDPGFSVVQTSDGTEILVDELSSAIVSVDFPHHEIHDGESFTSDIVDEQLGNNDTIILAWKTPSAPALVHMVLEFNTLVGGDLTLWEGATWTAGTGSLNPILNRKRDSVTTSILLEDTTGPGFTATDNLSANVTGLNTGAAIQLHHFHAWGVKNKISAVGARDDEWLLNPDTQYALVFTSSAVSNKAQITVNWYERTNPIIPIGGGDDMSLLFAVLAVFSVALTVGMFATKQVLLGFPSVIFWAILGGFCYDQSTATWDMWYFTFFASIGMAIFCSIAMYGLRNIKEELEDGDQMIDEKGGVEAEFYDDGEGTPLEAYERDTSSGGSAKKIRARADKRRGRK